jgi:hypothetical protein
VITLGVNWLNYEIPPDNWIIISEYLCQEVSRGEWHLNQ